MKELEKKLKALSNKRRLAIVKYLKSTGRASVGDIAGAIKLSYKATSKHLLILSNAEIIEKEQISLTVFHFLPRTNDTLVKSVLSLMR
ncbi:MAG: ArsR family transcriptional regulator [Patescibacteria group bacterium]